MRFGLPLLLALSMVPTVGCATPDRVLPGAGHAVVVYAPTRAADATATQIALERAGMSVSTVLEGPAVRTTSSAAVYDAGDRPARVETIRMALADVVDVSVLPFLHAGPGGTDVVVWLVEPGRAAD